MPGGVIYNTTLQVDTIAFARALVGVFVLGFVKMRMFYVTV